MQLCITGMHRSGTSFVASLIQKAGLDIGSDLYGPARGNRHGHFEDRDFVTFHEAILARKGLTFLTPISGCMEGFTLEEYAAAGALIERRNDLGLWGWKDPRTSLFLNFWSDLLPQARFVLVYRHPVEVVLSLLRRGTDLDVVRNNRLGLQAWQVYNQAILDFHRAHPDRCVLCNISGSTSNIPAFIHTLNSKLGLQLEADGLDALFVAGDLNQLSIDPRLNQVISLVDSACMNMYACLEQAADIPGPGLNDGGCAGNPAWNRLYALVQHHAEQGASHGALLHMALAAIDPQAVAESQADLVKYVDGLENTLGAQSLAQQQTTIPAWELERARSEVKVLEKDLRRFAQVIKKVAPGHPLLNPDMGGRYIRFADGHALGSLQIREWGSPAWEWQEYGLAVGEVKIPPHQEVYLTVNPDGYPFLAGLAELNPADLQSMFLGHLPVNDQDLAAISRLTGLQTLDLRVTRVTGEGLPALYGLVNLRTLVLPKQISRAPIQNLKNYLPNCQIVQDD